ncbi:MAG: UpxY family transcription antiterminator [Mucilaginibacter sp.]|nr:UpxY family transcription antiterminator [Mucilaginibacter sp.]
MIQTANRHWMVLYTRSRWEKKIDKLLNEQNINSFCPLVKTNRQWVDRKKVVEMPLFNSYLFVNATPVELAKAMRTSGVLTYISRGGKPATINDSEIERIKTIVENYSDVESVSLSNLKVGDNIKVKMGPLTDHEGEIHQIQGKSVVMIIKNLNCALTVKLDRKDIHYKD